MNSEQLRYFDLAYREGSFSAAARKIPVSHQGLTKSIRTLEKELDVQLFEADPITGAPLPTEFAHELHEFVGVFDSNVRLLRESFNRIRGCVRTRVNLGLSLGVLGALGPSFLSEFAALHSDIDVDYVEMTDAMCERGLLEERFDLAVKVGAPTPGCTARLLYRSPMYFWLRRDDELYARSLSRRLTIDDLAGRDIAIPGKDFACCAALRALADERGVELGQIIDMTEIFRIYSCAMEGIALGFSNGTLIDLPVFKDGDTMAAIEVEGLGWEFSIERLQTHATTSAEELLWNWTVRRATDIFGPVS